MAMKRKRVYAVPYKKQSRKKFKKRSSRRTTSYTNQASRLTNTLIKRRKRISVRTWRNQLWKSTQWKPKYRAFYTNSVSCPTQASNLNKSINARPMYYLGSGTSTPFWTSAGGAVPPDPAATFPTFDDMSIVLRGGRYKCIITAPLTNTEPIQVELWIVWTKNNPDLSVINTNPRDRAWDCILSPDINDCGRVVMAKKAMLTPGETLSFEYSFRIQKIDLSGYANFSNMPIAVLSSGNTISSIAQACTWLNMYSITFCGDSTT